MADKARKITDKELQEMEAEINKIYLRAYKDISREWDAYMKSHEHKVDEAKRALDYAIFSGDKNEIAKAREVYEHTVSNVTVNNKRFQDMRDEICAKMTNVNEVAVDYVNGNMPKIYTVNYNQFASEHIDGYSFALVNENAVKNLIKTGDLSLYKHVDPEKDKAWNEKYINSQVLQGILQGESIPKISERIFPEVNGQGGLINRNKATATRIARTMTTAAENKGRQDSFKKASSDGVKMEREWIAAHDDRTRAWHLDLHGVRVGVDEPWENEYGQIMYPGDPSADPANVYNCRCAIRVHVLGFEWNKETEAEPEKVEEPKQETIEAKVTFIPATSIEEAEDYAKQNFVTQSKWAGEGNVSFKGISLNNANAINEELTNLFAQNDVPKFRNIGVMNFRQNIWKDAKDAPMAYRNMFDGELYLNPNILKSEKTLDAYVTKGREVFDFCVSNVEKFSGAQRDLVERYKEAGRQTVADLSNKPLQAMLDHEFGHHVDHQIILKDKEFVQVTKDGMDEYGIKLSGYALHTRGEYVAESFCAYTTGLVDIDPELAKIFDGVKR